MGGLDSVLLVRKIGIVFAFFAAIHLIILNPQSWQAALALAAGQLLVSLLFYRAGKAASVIGFFAALGICAGFTLQGAIYGAVLYHILLLTIALEKNTIVTKRAAVTIITVFTGVSCYAAPVIDSAFLAYAAFNILGFYSLTYASVHLHLLLHKKQRDDTKMRVLMDQNNYHYRMAFTDELTGLYNHRAYKETVAELSGYAVVVVDIDHFKQLNDTYGHATGDKILALIGRTIAASTRQGDYAFRYGGEEFVIILPGASQAMGQSFAERLRQRIAESRFSHCAIPIPVTVSIGVALKKPGMAGQTAFEQADQALYSAKQQGRNRVCSWEPCRNERYQAN